MNTVLLRLTFWVCLVAGVCSAAPVDHWFEKANQFYSQQQFDSAAHFYEKIIESGTNSSEVYFNLGNSYFRLRKTGLARMYYEKAARLSPNDPDILANIKFVNANIADRVTEPEKGFLEMIFWRLHTLFPLQMQLWILLGMLTMLSLLISTCFFTTGNARLWFIYAAAILGFLVAGTGLSMGLKIYDSEQVGYAVIIAPAADARNEPDGTKILFTAHEGTKIKIRKSVEGWSLASLPNGVSGWIENSSLGNI